MKEESPFPLDWMQETDGDALELGFPDPGVNSVSGMGRSRCRRSRDKKDTYMGPRSSFSWPSGRSCPCLCVREGQEGNGVL